MDKQLQKQNLREALLKRREGISGSEYLQKSKQICERLIHLPEFKQAAVIHCYISINERNEVNTHSLIEKMLKMDKQLIVPITQMETGTLRNAPLENFDELKINKWGVLEPEIGPEIAVSTIELVVVPMVGGDSNKNRIGYGKGFYDRFLAQLECPKIGLLFQNCLAEKLPVESFDVQLDKIVTDKRVI